MADYFPTIGLEIHAELKTRTKMFCDSKNDPDEKQPNVNVCPVCMGHPGTLPVVNQEAVRHVLRVGVAVGGTLADFTEFDRKNYFYPDIPKGYQISQYKYPLVSGGGINGIRLTRIHLEEDTARSIHAADKGHSLVDFNRAGVPLMELVTEPVIHSGEEAVAFAKELQLLLRYLRVADADMEKGQMRVEANISVSPKSKVESQKLGTKVEVKNLNSFRSVERAVAYEIHRQVAALERGETIMQETRGWNDAEGETFSQRRKEYSHDYRYFPDPDVPKVQLSEIKEFDSETIKKELPELPWEKRKRLEPIVGQEAADIYVRNQEWQGFKVGDFFDAVLQHLGQKKELIQLASNVITSEVLGWTGVVKQKVLEPHPGFTGKINFVLLPDDFVTLVRMRASNKISSRGLKDILSGMLETGNNPEVIAEEKGLIQTSDESTLRSVVERVVAAHPDVVAEYKAGKTSVLQFLIGQAMRETRGAGNPQKLGELFEGTLK